MMLYDDPIFHWRFKELADYVIVRDENIRDRGGIQPPILKSELENARIVFCPPSRLLELCEFVRREGVKNRFVLIGGNDDYNITARYLELLPVNVVHFFARNLIEPEGGCWSMLPLGVSRDPRLLNFTPPAWVDKPKGLYLNFNINTNHGERDQALEWGMKCSVFEHKEMSLMDYTAKVCQSPIPWEMYMQEMADHKFVVCPPGGGIDTYRFWECMYMGCCPVTKKTGHFYWNMQRYNIPTWPMPIWELLPEMGFKWAAENYGKKNGKKEYINCRDVLTFQYWADKILKTADDLL